MSSIIKTFDDDIYIIKGKSPDQIKDLVETGGDMLRMPNGAYIHKKSIAGIQSYEDYSFQTEQKQRHKKWQYLKAGEWYDQAGSLGINSHLERITGEINSNALPPAKAKIASKK